MPRQRKGARLHWRKRGDGRDSVWEIRDGLTRLSCGTQDLEAAEAKLTAYLESKMRPTGPTASHDLTISMALTIYGEEHAINLTSPESVGYSIDALLPFWKNRPVSAITGASCREYASSRITKFGKPASNATIRRELAVLQAAVNYCHREGYLTSAPVVTLPAPPPARQRWLTRQEAAWLLRGARHLQVSGKHLADFILHGLYTGSRKQTILAMRLDVPSLRGGHVDTVNGILYRKPQGKSETKKRQRPARLPRRYLSYLRSQTRNGRRYVVEDYKGRQVGDIRKAWSRAVVLAEELAARKGIEIDLSDVTPHTLKHTAITWLLQRGATIWDAAGYFSTSAETIEKVYGHHSPYHQKSALDAFDRRQ